MSAVVASVWLLHDTAAVAGSWSRRAFSDSVSFATALTVTFVSAVVVPEITTPVTVAAFTCTLTVMVLLAFASVKVP